MNRLLLWLSGLCAMFACFTGCSSVPVVRFTGWKDAVRVSDVFGNTPQEIRFKFSDNVALFWRVDLNDSWLQQNDERIPIKTRKAGRDPDGNIHAMEIYVSRLDGARFATGRYRYQLALDTAFPDYPRYKRRDVEIGSFSVRYMFPGIRRQRGFRPGSIGYEIAKGRRRLPIGTQ